MVGVAEDLKKPRWDGPDDLQFPSGGDPASFAQQRLWFVDRLRPGSPAYHLPAALRLTGQLDAAVAERSLCEAVCRHEALRTVFRMFGGQLIQVVLPDVPCPLPIVDLSHLPPVDREVEAARRMAVEFRRAFDLERGPLLRAGLFRLAAEDHILWLEIHHIACDGWSMGILFQDFAAAYAAFLRGEPSPLPRLPVHYAEYATAQRARMQGETLRKHLTYWKRRLDGLAGSLELPTDRPRPDESALQGGTRFFSLPMALTEALESLSRREVAWLFMTLLASFQALLQRYTGQNDVAVGTPVADRPRRELHGLIGCFLNVVVLRTDLSGDPTFRELLRRVRTMALRAYAHQELPFERLVEELRPARLPGRQPLTQVMFTLLNDPTAGMALPGLKVAPIAVDCGAAQYDLALTMTRTEAGLNGAFEYDSDLFDAATVDRMIGHFKVLLEAAVADPDRRLSDLPLLTEAERQQLLSWNDTRAEYPRDRCVHDLFEAQAERMPQAVAVVCREQSVTYAELNRQADGVARRLGALGVGPGCLVGVCVHRSVGLVAALLGTLKAGAAYVPLDPSYPRERLGFMLEDARVSAVLTSRDLAPALPPHGADLVLLDAQGEPEGCAAPAGVNAAARPDDVAYVLFTSGSSGRPKGVAVRHRNVVNFFTGMDDLLEFKEPGTWLAVTSTSFDISVLELFWTLARGFKVVIQEEAVRAEPAARPLRRRKMDFSLFYFAADAGDGGGNKYRLLLEGARFADENGFAAVWTPERHFHPFGGLYPNPAVTGAALAAITKRVQIRCGSVVLPLHNPIRVAEEWAVVDNLSGGRVGLSFASGWHAGDFALMPDNFKDRREVMLRGIDTVRRLWRGEAVRAVSGTGADIDVRIYPAPVRRDPPLWLTAAGSVETFRTAGRMGANLLTNLLGQTAEELAEKIADYRQARLEAGHAGPGYVTLMLHTFVGPDLETVRARVRGPFLEYLRTSTDLIRKARWDCPAFTVRGDRGLAPPDDSDLTEAEMQAIMDHAFDRYFRSSGLFGTPDMCLEMTDRLSDLGVDEIACLIDFGVDADAVLDGLRCLDEVRRRSDPANEPGDYSIPGQLRRHHVTHFQCTPSLARVLAADADSLDALRPLRKFLVGGEALPPDVARRLTPNLDGDLINVYGPTETTVWSTAAVIDRSGGPVTIGRPLANTQVYVLDPRRRPVPVGVPGELYIGGDGVARGYLHRPDLTAERFVPDPFSAEPGARLYRSGDLVRFGEDGQLEYLGRMDHQVKVRGHRIELGEIEAVLAAHPAVRESVVVASSDAGGDRSLVAYVVPRGQPGVVPSDLRPFLGSKLPSYMVPSAFVPLERLPLTLNGKVDRAALPKPGLVESGGPRPAVAPRDETEAELALVWREVLGKESVSVTEDFFDSGGNSLLAMSLVARVERTFGKKVSLVRFFQASTIEAVAAGLREDAWESPQTRVFAMRAEGTQAPLIIVDAGPFYRPLVRRLGRDQPVFGLSLPKLSALPERFSVSDIAADLVKALCASGVDGPYYLAGWSAAGLFAYEMAQQLRSRDKEVSLLTLFDTHSPEYRRSFQEWRKFPIRAYLWLEKVLYHLWKARTMPSRQAWRHFREGMQKFRRPVPKGAQEKGVPGAVDEYSWQIQYRTELDYCPEPCDMPVVLFRSTALQKGWFRDPQLGWGAVVRRGLTVHEMPGEHDAMFLEPHVQRLAALWKECAQRVTAAGGGASPGPAPEGRKLAGVKAGVEILSLPGHRASIRKEPSVQFLARSSQSAVDNSDKLFSCE
jgi:natural product biosynthesis luciferase-like monooxygenase protein